MPPRDVEGAVPYDQSSQNVVGAAICRPLYGNKPKIYFGAVKSALDFCLLHHHVAYADSSVTHDFQLQTVIYRDRNCFGQSFIFKLYLFYRPSVNDK